MLKGIDINQRIDFTSSEDKTEPKTVFVLRPFTGAEMMSFAKLNEAGAVRLTGDEVYAFLDKAITEIRNFSEPKSKTEIIESLPITVIGELFAEIGKMNNLTGQDQKNS